MDTLRIAICDDEILLLPQLSSIIKNIFHTHHMDVEPTAFSEAPALLEALYNGADFSVYFLDIDIPEIDGISLAEKIRLKNPDALILFVSAREELVYDTFRVQPLAFVRKSHFSDDIHKAMDTLMNHLQKPEDEIILFQDELRHKIPINLTRTLYIEANEKYQDIVTMDGTDMIRCAIADLEAALTSHSFVRVHRGYLVNLRYVHRIDPTQIILDTGHRVPMSRHRKKEVQALFLEYSRTAKNF